MLPIEVKSGPHHPLKNSGILYPVRLEVNRTIVGKRLQGSTLSSDMQVKPLMPERPKVERPDQEGLGSLRRARTVEEFTSGTRLLIRRDCASEPAVA